MLIAEVVFLLERIRTRRDTDATDPFTHASATSGVDNKRTASRATFAPRLERSSSLAARSACLLGGLYDLLLFFSLYFI